MTLNKVVVRSPATIANLGPGFDVFGIALKEPADLIEVRRTSELGVRVEKIEGIGAHGVTIDNSRNTAAVAAQKVLEMGNADFGLRMSIKKGIRPASGMGSSGASAAGGAYAANLMLETPFPVEKLVYSAALGEEASSGSRHADNAGPALLGGFTIIRSYEPMEIVRVSPPANLGIVAMLPSFAVPTREARKVLPKTIDMKSLIFQVGHAASLVAGMANKDVYLVARSMKDVVVEPARAQMVPHLKEAEEAALEGGALASFLGGSGPCIGAIFDIDTTDGIGIAQSVQSFFENHGIDCLSWVTTWGEGCRRVSE